MEELRGVLFHLHQASGNFQLASTNLPAISETLARKARDLPGLVLQTQTSMRELERFIDALQRHWLFRRYMNKPDPGDSRQQKRR
jgi:hypothetical protein